MKLPLKELQMALAACRKLWGKCLRAYAEIDLSRGELAATDGASYFTYQLGKPIGEGVVALDFAAVRHLTKPAKNYDSSEVEISALGGVAFIKCGSLKLRLPKKKAEIRPPRPRAREHALDAGTLRRAALHASEDESRPALRHIALEKNPPSDEPPHHPVDVVATDGRTFFWDVMDCKIPNTVYLLAAPIWNSRAFHGDTWTLRVEERKNVNYNVLSSGKASFISSDYAGHYPEWRKVLPAEVPRTRYTIGEKDAAALLKAKCEVAGLIVKGKQARMVTSAFRQAVGKWDEFKLEDTTTSGLEAGSHTLVCLNAGYLRRLLRNGFRAIDILDDISPVVSRSAGSYALIMPARLSNFDEKYIHGKIPTKATP